ncbi:hypothetical protein CCMA1212_000526, partial [Trichoderma ghanense]
LVIQPLIQTCNNQQYISRPSPSLQNTRQSIRAQHEQLGAYSTHAARAIDWRPAPGLISRHSPKETQASNEVKSCRAGTEAKGAHLLFDLAAGCLWARPHWLTTPGLHSLETNRMGISLPWDLGLGTGDWRIGIDSRGQSSGSRPAAACGAEGGYEGQAREAGISRQTRANRGH